MVGFALELVGSKSRRYTNGHPELGQSPEGFDCSGFVRYVLIQSGFYIPDFIGMDGARRPIRHANEFFDHYGVSVETPELGDLVVWSRHGRFPTHIGFVYEDGQYIHAPGNEGSTVTIERFVKEPIPALPGIGRVLFTTNPIGYKTPTVPLENPSNRHHQRLAD